MIGFARTERGAQRHAALCGEVAAFIRRGDRDDAEREFERLALAVFAYQFETIAPYHRLCRGLGRTPDTVSSWRAIPAIPAQAYKQHRLFAGAPDAIVRTFRSSGTTEPGRTSQSHFSRPGLAVMDAAIAASAASRVFSDGRATRILVLTPPPDQAPHMVMAHGMSQLVAAFGAAGSRFVGGASTVDFAALRAELEAAQRDGTAVSLLGPSFGFVHFFDYLAASGRRLALPPGSRLLDAGGYKGKSREISRDAFVAWAAQSLGLPTARVINLLGMTELASQVYDRVAPGGMRMKLPPHWMRTSIVDPRRFGPDGPEPVHGGDVGLLRHVDLASIERPMAIQSEDIGRYVGPAVPAETGQRGFEILGRAKGAEPRGCSLTAEDVAGDGEGEVAA